MIMSIKIYLDIMKNNFNFNFFFLFFSVLRSEWLQKVNKMEILSQRLDEGFSGAFV